MAVYRRTARPRFTLLLLVLTAITLLTLDERSHGMGFVDTARDAARDGFAPVQDAANTAFRPVIDFFQGAFHYGDVEAENARLRQQLADQEAGGMRAADAEREREKLLDLSGLDFVGDVPTVAARVVETPASGFDLTLELDRGRDAGVARGMPVVSGGGLVGQVIDVSRRRATVRLITDASSNVGVRLASTGDIGVAAGRGAGSKLRVDLIDPATKVDKGEAVVTSGLQNSDFPPGIPVGKVVAATSSTDALQQDVTIEPTVDFRHLEFVKVLQRAPGG
ncbi:MAG TPA: rod shape-determining protein MreC [Acidimicrobiales bacterium]|nr:rod shape-determining protein MreC [Acidimicrobiales bacterium]